MAHYRFQSAGRVYDLSIERLGEGFQAGLDGHVYHFEILDSQPGEISLLFEGRPARLVWAESGGQVWIASHGCTYHLEKPASRSSSQPVESNAERIVRSPMPARVRAVQVAQGEKVDVGQTLLLLEAMKMEIRVKAPVAGSVARLLVADGQAVEKDQTLAEIGD